MSQSPVVIKQWTASKRYLYLPVKNGSEKVVMQVQCGGQVVREFDIELAQYDPPDWWASYDITAFQGADLELLAVDGAPVENARDRLAEMITEGDEVRSEEPLYEEPYRPQLHFTPRQGWNNDPNGMVYYDGSWHMYFQHNPFGIRWGNMHWGHAASPDLVHWREHSLALYQRSLADMAFSGGGFVDWKNTSGVQAGDKPPLFVAFTSTGRGECLAYSSDGGMTFEELPENPVVEHQGRDPKIFWYEPGQKWVMIVYEETGPEFGYAFYDSTNLKQWNRLSFFPGYFECPEMLEIAAEGQPGRKYWVVCGNLRDRLHTACSIGTFDGVTFTPEQENRMSHYGPNFYAAQIFSDAPDGRWIMIGWLRDATYPGASFGQGMTVPLELTLRQTSQGLRLCYYPVRELEALREGVMTIQETSTEHANVLLEEVSSHSELLDIRLVLYTTDDHSTSLDVRGYPIHFHSTAGAISFAGSQAKLEPGKNELELRVLVDRSVTEVFANGGEAAFSALTLFKEGKSIRLEGSAWVKEMQVYRLRSIW